MRAVIQRVSFASVKVDDEIISQIGPGLLILLGIEDADDGNDVAWLAKKITSLRIFSDSEGKMNLDLKETNGGLLVVSQFTLHASTKKGTRPSFIKAARPDKAIPLYESFIHECESLTSRKVETGMFGATMDVELLNDGPITINIDTKNKE
ncbi:MAG: D-tyrosyl-tRNA(Tyr) deacylase [Crocinitomicaceae bacterium]|nr:D-tyrosyl-tRNA(Tyr) deacylase [Crocinitomicaceae bacterium]|tara:strand:- start:3606 stop:4058 length:453 start_codon:yes stop_codon:yes gene_type:complete